MKARRLIIPLTLAAALAVTGCAAGGSSDTATVKTDPAVAFGSADNAKQMQVLYEAAKKGNETTIVTYGPGESIYKPVYQQFSKRFPGIRVTSQTIFGAELDTRLTQEFTSNKHVGSLQIGGAPVTLLTAGKDRCEAYAPFTSDYEDSSLIAPDGTYRAVVGWPYGIEYNTDKLTEAEAPKSWKELTEPKWKGKIAMQDPTRISGTANTITRMLYDGRYDESFLRGLAANDPLIIADSGPTEQAVASGQREVNFVAQYIEYLRTKAKGLPIGIIFPTEDGTTLEYHYTCLLKDSPVPHASKLLVNWLFTPEGQKAMASIGVYGVLEGAQPKGLPTMGELAPKLLKAIPVEEQSALTKNALALSKEIFR
ncbi:ABC transporter substrate-binding protein [Microbacterium kribbense]|uniref:ABC transporter substrate-binding protein n=1 Tax=Microbacterium kribbense TaxID=433645 RepID=A0ABP7GQ10_9MICO